MLFRSVEQIKVRPECTRADVVATVSPRRSLIINNSQSQLPLKTYNTQASPLNTKRSNQRCSNLLEDIINHGSKISNRFSRTITEVVVEVEAEAVEEVDMDRIAPNNETKISTRECNNHRWARTASLSKDLSASLKTNRISKPSFANFSSRATAHTKEIAVLLTAMAS